MAGCYYHLVVCPGDALPAIHDPGTESDRGIHASSHGPPRDFAYSSEGRTTAPMISCRTWFGWWMLHWCSRVAVTREPLGSSGLSVKDWKDPIPAALAARGRCGNMVALVGQMGQMSWFVSLSRPSDPQNWSCRCLHHRPGETHETHCL